MPDQFRWESNGLQKPRAIASVMKQLFAVYPAGLLPLKKISEEAQEWSKKYQGENWRQTMTMRHIHIIYGACFLNDPPLSDLDDEDMELLEILRPSGIEFISFYGMSRNCEFAERLLFWFTVYIFVGNFNIDMMINLNRVSLKNMNWGDKASDSKIKDFTWIGPMPPKLKPYESQGAEKYKSECLEKISKYLEEYREYMNSD